ncbi:MAG: stage IV sporulation protein A [Clostridia bacterium]|nr:stage IV sporulation protein A [Clostridia bacterium]
MAEHSIYKDIAERTGGDIYIGVVGPVRTGKSTLLKKFMEHLILPGITGEHMRERAKDEMPQSGSGRTVMTTEPKFIPEEAAEVFLDEKTSCRVKLIDCVGYIVPGVMGHLEEGQPRMVMTPWSAEPLPFEAAAEMGTEKVIKEHATIGIVVTTDGSIGEIPRENYEEAEERVIGELKALEKPFAVVMNSRFPASQEVLSLCTELEDRYGVPVVPVNCLEMGEQEILSVLQNVLYQFPLREVRVQLPRWLNMPRGAEALRRGVLSQLSEKAEALEKMGSVRRVFEGCALAEGDAALKVCGVYPGNGSATVEVCIPETVFFRILGEQCGYEIENEEALMEIMAELSDAKRKYDKVASAMEDVMETGYGIVMPTVEDMRLEEPEIVKQPGGYGVKLKASAPSIHMMKADIQTEVSPMVGTESQSEELVKFLLKEFEADPGAIWNTNMFGKSLHELVSEGLNGKLAHMPKEAREKITGTIGRIINEGSGGLICILL